MSDLRDILKSLTAQQISERCQVDLATARRWRRQATCPPKTAQMILTGDLGIIDPAWAGWVLRRGLLCSPENWTATPGDVRAMQLKEAQVSALRRETLELRAKMQAMEVESFEEQPLPDSWNVQIG